ncbi:MAG: ribosome-associated translation inhibitor RaiA [Parachlamydiales bacterium]|nr:ribosome-associated translation inhibitor RaiA [Parachlamydiales bacterium]
MTQNTMTGETPPFNITITGRHIQVTDAIKDYALEKIAKVERFTHRVIDVMICLEVQRQEQKVSIVMHFDHTVIKADVSSDNMYSSIDQAVGKLCRQIQRYKGRIHDIHQKGASAVDMNVDVFEGSIDDIEEVNDLIDDESRKIEAQRFAKPEIVKREKMPLKTLTREEALIKMDLSGAPFMVYRSEEDKKIKVIYLREEKHFGIIEPE